MTANKKIPALRFKEFEGEWEEKKLGEMCSAFKSGNSITGNDIYETGNFPVYGGNGLRGYTNSYTHDGFYVLIGRQGALCGNINRAIGKTFISEHAIAAQSNESSDTEWLAQKLELMKLNQYSESSAQPGLAVNKLVKLKIISPSLLEQQKIAAFLVAVDDKIQQLTKKKALLEQYKKGLMQQIFNQQIRFKDDDGKDYPDWEEKKLGDVISSIKAGKTKPENEGFFNVYGSTGIIGYCKEFSHSGSFILIARVGANAGKLDIVNGKFGVTDNTLVVDGSNYINLKFLFYLLLVYNLNRLVFGSGQPLITGGQLSKLLALVPSKEEQQKIANFVTGIDNKIDLVNQQLENTKEFKKGLLQQMFV